MSYFELIQVLVTLIGFILSAITTWLAAGDLIFVHTSGANGIMHLQGRERLVKSLSSLTIQLFLFITSIMILMSPVTVPWDPTLELMSPLRGVVVSSILSMDSLHQLYMRKKIYNLAHTVEPIPPCEPDDKNNR